jgi:hypothetical protein
MRFLSYREGVPERLVRRWERGPALLRHVAVAFTF